ncbi:hypothetical protein HD806DRAFT_544781 [Xylariaceae sp. AK1471]|nr:hypothetical protein HD806DRAFT_544781 [Xylariaceae sp. AK1471]
MGEQQTPLHPTGFCLLKSVAMGIVTFTLSPDYLLLMLMYRAVANELELHGDRSKAHVGIQAASITAIIPILLFWPPRANVDKSGVVRAIRGPLGNLVMFISSLVASFEWIAFIAKCRLIWLSILPVTGHGGIYRGVTVVKRDPSRSVVFWAVFE